MFNSLITLNGVSAGLGVGAQGACHLIHITMEMLVPRDVEAGRIPANDVVVFHDYDTHFGVRVYTEDEKEIANERPVYSYKDLANFLVGAYNTQSQVVEPIDPELDERLEALRDAALAEVNAPVGSDDDFIDEDEDDDEEFEFDADTEEELDADEEGEDTDADEDSEESDVITISAPTSKPGSKKFKKELGEIVAVLHEYFDEDIVAAGLDNDTLNEALEAVFSETNDLDLVVGIPLLEQFSDYVEFE